MVKAYSTTAVSGGTVAGAGTFDIGVKRTSGTIVGMMTRKDARSVPQYQVYDDEYLASQFFTGEPGYGALPSEKEIAIIQSDWRSGFGLEVYDASDPKRYRTSNGMDMRFRGMAIAGPIATAIHGTAGWRSPTSFSDPNSVWANEANAYDEATTTRASSDNLSGVNSLIQFPIVSTPCDSIRYYVGRSSLNISNLKISVYYGGVWNIILNAAPTWDAWTTVNIGSTQNVTTIELVFTHDAPGGIAYVYEIDYNINGNISLGNVKTSADFNDLLYICSATELWKQNASGNGFTYVRGFPANITDLEVFGSNLFIAIGTSNACWYMSTAEAFTESTATVKNFKYFKTVDAAEPTLWGSDSANTIRSTINPVNGGVAWSGVTTIASSWDDITGLFSDSGLLYVDKEDMPYYLNSAGAVKNDLAPEMGTLARSTDNGKSANWWLHNFYMPWGSSLLEEDGGVLTWRSPNDYSTQLADFVGTVFAVAGDDHYLFAIIDNSTKIEVLAGRKEIIDGTTKWVWHPINETTLTGCETCWTSAVYQKRLWISSTLSTESLYYIPLPVAYGNVLSDANRTFLTTTTMETSWLHGNFRSTTKAFIRLTLELGHTYDVDIYFTVKYKLLEDTAWTTIGNFTGSATSMIQSRYIPVDAESNNPKSTLFKLQFTAVTDDTTKTPVLLNYQLKAVLYPDQREIIAMKVYCANELGLRDGGQDIGSYDTIIATLDEARTATYPITLYDIDGTVRTGKLLPLPAGVPRWKLITNEANRQYEREYNILFQLITVA